MTIKGILYIIMVPIVLYALDSVNYEKFIKANKVFQARLLFLLITLGISYLSVNFIYEFFINSQMI